MSEENNNEGNNDESKEIIHEDIIEVDLPALFGDLVEIEGFDFRVFKVYGYRIENWHTVEKSWVELVYELLDAVNGEWLEADAEDIELLADADKAEIYLQTVDIENYPASFMATLNDSNNEVGGDNMAKGKGEGESRRLTPKEQSAKDIADRKQAVKDKYAKTDDLLALLTWTTNTYKKTGERRYKEWAETIKADLKNLHPKEGE